MSRGAGDQCDFFSDHERGIETYAKLTDQFAVADSAGFFEFFQKRFCAGLGNRADVFHHFVIGHADAVVADGQRVGRFVGVKRYFKIRVVFQQIMVGQRLHPDFVDGIRCVGDQFAQKYFPVGIDGVDHQVEQLLGFGLKFASLFCHGVVLLCRMIRIIFYHNSLFSAAGGRLTDIFPQLVGICEVGVE